MTLSLPSAFLIGTILEAFAYGVYLAMLPRGFAILRKRGLKGAIRKYLHFTLFATLVSLTVHFCIAVTRIMRAFTSNAEEPKFAEHYLGVFNTPSAVILSVCNGIVLIIVNGLIVLRTYVIWNHDRRILALSVTFFMVNSATVVWLVVALASNPLQWRSPLLSPVWMMATAFASSLVLNIICTALIAYKIRKAQHVSDRLVSIIDNRMKRVSFILVQSAAVHTLVNSAMLVFTLTARTALYVIIYLTPPLMGISFLYVIISTSNIVPESAVREPSERRGPNQIITGDHGLPNGDDDIVGVDSTAISPAITVQIHLEQTIRVDDDWPVASVESDK
ncbi:unnamed protein product [Somion occarium]|uniref:Gustatory receptor n=1 Tax=Somion occarium TaxID=3059160 RepID=A0ABP1DZI1_9APHY